MRNDPGIVCFCGGGTVLRHARCSCSGSCGCGASRCDRCAGRLDGGLVFRMLPCGAFVAGDRGSGFTCYAYPTSTYATQAKRNPEKTARLMMRRENDSGRLVPEDICKRYDAHNWALLDAPERSAA
jgi:hypothetical protein